MGKIELRTFDGDVDALRDMAYETLFAERGHDAWLDLNRPKMARYLLAEVPDPRFLIAAYDGTTLVAFIANLPRQYRLNGQTYTGVVSTMLAARKDYRGAVVYLIAECLRRNREFGADFALMLLEKGVRSWHMFRKYFKPKYRIERMKTMYALIRVVDLEKLAEGYDLRWYDSAAARLFRVHRPLAAPPVPGTVRPYRDADLVSILALTGRHSDRGCLVRVLDEKTLARRLHTEGLTATIVYERGGRVAGFINFTVHEVLSRRGRSRWLWMDFLYWGGLSGKEKRALLAGLWQAAQEQGCAGIMEWDKGCYGKGPLFRSRFVPYPQFLEVDAWVFNPNLSLRGVSKLCEQVV